MLTIKQRGDEEKERRENYIKTMICGKVSIKKVVKLN